MVCIIVFFRKVRYNWNLDHVDKLMKQQLHLTIFNLGILFIFCNEKQFFALYERKAFINILYCKSKH